MYHYLKHSMDRPCGINFRPACSLLIGVVKSLDLLCYSLFLKTMCLHCWLTVEVRFQPDINPEISKANNIFPKVCGWKRLK